MRARLGRDPAPIRDARELRADDDVDDRDDDDVNITVVARR